MEEGREGTKGMGARTKKPCERLSRQPRQRKRPSKRFEIIVQEESVVTCRVLGGFYLYVVSLLCYSMIWLQYPFVVYVVLLISMYYVLVGKLCKKLEIVSRKDHRRQ